MYLVGGGKGGVGKSMTSMAMLDWLLHERKADNILLVETDTSNPDVFKSYESTPKIATRILDLDTDSGWVYLMNDLPAWSKAGTHIVVNTAARSSVMLTRQLPYFLAGANELGMRIELLWPINRQLDSLLLLDEVLQAAPDLSVTVVRNLYAGTETMFIRYENSNLRKRVRTIDLPNLNDLVADQIYCNRLPLHEDSALLFGERSMLNRFRKESSEQFNKLLE